MKLHIRFYLQIRRVSLFWYFKHYPIVTCDNDFVIYTRFEQCTGVCADIVHMSGLKFDCKCTWCGRLLNILTDLKLHFYHFSCLVSLSAKHKMKVFRLLYISLSSSAAMEKYMWYSPITTQTSCQSFQFIDCFLRTKFTVVGNFEGDLFRPSFSALLSFCQPVFFLTTLVYGQYIRVKNNM